LIAAGDSVSRAEYANLFSVIGTTYGSVSGDTFTLPDLRGAFVCGANASTKVLGTTGGSDTNTLSIANLPQHQHNVNHSHAPTDAQGSHQHFVEAWTGQNWVQGIFGYQGPAIGGGGYLIQSQSTYSGFAGNHAHNVPAYTGLSGVGGGLSTPIDIRPPFIHLNYIIKT
jgi:microcystin-dependent protein